MKKLITLLAVLFLFGCDDYEDLNSSIETTKGVVLKKETSCFRGACSYGLYVFDGHDARWFKSDLLTYEKYAERDTMNVVLITKTVVKK